MREIKTEQPLEMKVSPHKWTTKVNVALVIGVTVVFLIGIVYGIYAVTHPREVHENVHEDVAPKP